MNKSLTKKKFASIAATGVAFLALFAVGSFYALNSSDADLTVHASVEETEEKIRVFVGDIDQAPENYIQTREAYIQTAALQSADRMLEAVVGFNDYYSVETVANWADEHDIDVNRVYMWPKGETGRLAIRVENGNIADSIEGYKQYVATDGLQDEQFIKDHQRFLDGEYEIFAVTVTASAEDLEALNTDAGYVNYVDVMYNDEAEAYAAKSGKTVSYIELPSKPDGAL